MFAKHKYRAYLEINMFWREDLTCTPSEWKRRAAPPSSSSSPTRTNTCLAGVLVEVVELGGVLSGGVAGLWWVVVEGNGLLRRIGWIGTLGHLGGVHARVLTHDWELKNEHDGRDEPCRNEFDARGERARVVTYKNPNEIETRMFG